MPKRIALILLMFVLLLICLMACSETPQAPTVAKKEAITDYPRNGRPVDLDALPISTQYVPDSRYSGISVPWPGGACDAIPVHGYPLDSVGWVIDVWLTTRCTAPGYYDLLTVYLITDEQRFAPYLNASVYAENVRTGNASHRAFIFGPSIFGRKADPRQWCLDRPELIRFMSSPITIVPQTFDCLAGRADSLRVKLTLRNPVTADGLQCPPRPTVILFELSNSTTAKTITAPFYVTACSQ